MGGCLCGHDDWKRNAPVHVHVSTRNEPLMTTDIKIPDIGDFKNIPVIDVHVKAGQSVAAEESLITLESDKATMDVPAPRAGVIAAVLVKAGDSRQMGTVIATWADAKGAVATAPAAPAAAAAPAPRAAVTGDLHAEILVLGAGPGGYTAAFRAADLGKKVVLVERWPMLGGVCLNVGCIPSKALLHAAKILDEASDMSSHGISFGKPQIDLDQLRSWKDGVVRKLVGGLSGLAKARKVTVVTGNGAFTGPNTLAVTDASGKRTTISFDHAIIAAGSEPVTMPFIPHNDPRVID